MSCGKGSKSKAACAVAMKCLSYVIVDAVQFDAGAGYDRARRVFHRSVNNPS